MIDTLDALTMLMRQNGAERIYAKKLAPNDNSKNQIYLGGDFSVLNIIPHGIVETDSSAAAGSVRDRAKASVRFGWVDEDGYYVAPNAQIILYPKYPEVRMSGFLKGCRKAPSNVMNVRDSGRVLFLGITRDGRMLGYAAAAGSPLANAVHALTTIELAGVFVEISAEPRLGGTRQRLLQKLAAIYQKHWIRSQKLGADGRINPYSAPNGGGYTLEAELGITPNGYAEPDYLGWEIKQYSVNNFEKYRPKSPVTLLTPEPTGGFYREQGVEAFVRRFGYSDKNGKVSIENLPIGNYVLVERKAPAGYQLSAKPWKIIVGSDRNITVTHGEDTVSPNGNEKIYQLTNAKLYSLPESGGPGTYGFTISGVAILATALLLFINNKRREEEAKRS